MLNINDLKFDDRGLIPAICRIQRTCHIKGDIVKNVIQLCAKHAVGAQLGVIRRKPEIRYKDLSSLRSLPALQYSILEQSAAMVRAGGVLQYSTCTLNPAENEAIVDRFLREHTEFSPRILPLEPCFEALGIPPAHHITLFPAVHGSDGFFIAGFTKK